MLKKLFFSETTEKDGIVKTKRESRFAVSEATFSGRRRYLHPNDSEKLLAL